jgi:phosphatidylglycerophosphatase A
MPQLDPRNPVHLVACGFGSGLAPKAPGTFGTLAAIPLWLLIQMLSWPMYLAVVIAAFALGVWVCDRTARDMGVHDHGALVWDEFVGLWITLAAIPLALVPLHWFWITAGVIVFRVFDIWKPWPIRWFDRNVHGGLGVMLDDAVAGVFALAVLLIFTVFISVTG